MNGKRRRLLATLITASAFLLAMAGCQSSSPTRASVETPEPQPRLIREADGGEALQLGPSRPAGMTSMLVREVELPGVLTANGQVAFDDRRVATIVARVGGRIERTRVSQWDRVRRGEPIVQLYSPDFMTAEAEYLQARTTASLSLSAQVGAGDLGAAMLSAAKRKLELLGMSDADIAALVSPNPLVWIRAPISGTVLENKALRGAQVSSGDVLYSLGSLDVVWIVANIYEDDLARVREGQALEAVTTAYPQEVFNGFVSRISPNIDANTHTLQIRCEVRNPEGKLKPQMFARVRMMTRQGSMLVVPQEALIFDTSAYYAFVDIGGGRFERRRVEVGPAREQGMARVTAGLRSGERVVASESIQLNALWHRASGEGS